MRLATIFAALGCTVVACTPGPVPGEAALASLEPPELERLWSDALSWDDFRARLGDRAGPWDRTYRETVIREDFEDRASVLPGVHRILAVAEADCVACAATVPALARLAERVAGVELRVIGPERGAALFEAREPPAALPVAILLDAGSRDLGCWIVDPGVDERADARALDEVILVMEEAGRGARRCPPTVPG